MFTDLDTSTVDAERAVIHVTEFLVWWFEAGRDYYNRRRVQEDEGLRLFAADAIDAVGGWAAARRLLRKGRAEPASADAVDPSAAHPGTPATRV